ISPRAYLTGLQEMERSSQPDLMLQHAHHIECDLERQGHGPVEVRVDSRVALNGRRSARLIDPTRDLTPVRDGLGHRDWVLPAPEQPPPHTPPVLWRFPPALPCTLPSRNFLEVAFAGELSAGPSRSRCFPGSLWRRRPSRSRLLRVPMKRSKSTPDPPPMPSRKPAPRPPPHRTRRRRKKTTPSRSPSPERASLAPRARRRSSERSSSNASSTTTRTPRSCRYPGSTRARKTESACAPDRKSVV